MAEEWESLGARHRSRRIRRVAASAALLLVVAAALLVEQQRSSPSAAGDLRRAFQAAAREADRPFVYRVRLTPEATKVADEFVDAEYVTHDCGRLASLTSTLPIAETIGPIGDACGDAVAIDRREDAHLVRGSRRVVHDCRAGILGFGAPLRTNQCLRYATEGLSNPASGLHYSQCTGRFVDVFLREVSGRWGVVAESMDKVWAGPCSADDVSAWRRRVPWRKP